MQIVPVLFLLLLFHIVPFLLFFEKTHIVYMNALFNMMQLQSKIKDVAMQLIFLSLTI